MTSAPTAERYSPSAYISHSGEAVRQEESSNFPCGSAPKKSVKSRKPPVEESRARETPAARSASSASSSAGSYSPTYLQARDLTASASPSQPKAANNPLQAGVGDGLGQGSVAARESDFSRIGADSAQRQQTAVDMQRDIAERREGSLMQALKKRGLGENISPETQKKINQILKQ